MQLDGYEEDLFSFLDNIAKISKNKEISKNYNPFKDTN